MFNNNNKKRKGFYRLQKYCDTISIVYNMWYTILFCWVFSCMSHEVKVTVGQPQNFESADSELPYYFVLSSLVIIHLSFWQKKQKANNGLILFL